MRTQRVKLMIGGLSSLIVLALIMPAIFVLAAGPASFTLADLGEKDIIAQTVFNQSTVHFPVAAGRQIKTARLRLHLEHDPALLSNLSSLTIALNDEPVINLPLTPDNADKSFIDVSLPAQVVQTGDNRVLFQFQLRLQDTGCADYGDPHLWARIYNDTALELDGEDAPLTPDLSQWPAPFITLSTLPGNARVTIVLPPQPTSPELTAAAQIAAALGQAAHWDQPPLRAITANQIDDSFNADHLIVIDTAQRNPLARGALAGVTTQVSPRNPNRLMVIVSGADAIGLAQAAANLTTRSVRSHLSGAYVTPMTIEAQTQSVRATLSTFAELGEADRRVAGLGLHDVYYPISLPYDWKPTSEATLELRFTHAHGLDRSHMSTFVNGFKVTDVALVNRNADDGRLIIQLSPRQIHPGRNWLHLAFELHLPREDCNFRYLDEAWAAVSAATSRVNLQHVISEPPLDVRYLPSPLITPLDLSETQVVLPTAPTPAELSALAVVAAKLGTYVETDGVRLTATTVDQFDPATTTASHIVAIGAPDRNELLRRYADQLPQPLTRTADGTIAAAGGRELFLAETHGQAGYIQLLPAPWSAQSVLMVIAAFDDQTLAATLDRFPTLGQRVSVQGNVAVIDSAGVIGLSLGGLAGVPLSSGIRELLAPILIGAVLVVGGVGVWSYRRRAAINKREAEDVDE
jgi:hypothetical protein